jgi:PAS domain S-box-containing protein
MAERLKTEQALSNSEQRFRAIFDSVNDAIFVQDLSDGRILEVNQKMCEMYGCTSEEVRHLTFENLSAGYAPYRQQDAIGWWQKTASGEPQVFEWQAKDRAGRLFWVEINMRRAVIDGLDRLLVVVRDIDERKRTTERERYIGTGLRAAIEAAQELMDCADLDTLYRRSVELAREKIGLERCGLHLLDEDQQYLLGTYGTDDRGQTTDEHHERVAVAERSEVFTVPDRLWTVLHKPFTYLREGVTQVLPQSGWIAATPIRSRQQNIGMLYNDTAISQAPLDKTQQEVIAVYGSLLGGLIELKRTEAKLAHERDLLQSLMDNIPDAIYFKDTASRFTHVNQAMIRILGLRESSEAVGKTDADFFSGTLNQMYLDEEQGLLRTGQPLLDRVEYNPAPDGRPRWFSASKVPLRDASGRSTGMVGISRDVTERVLAQRRDQTISQGLRAVIEAVDELIGCADLDTLYRRAVELAREKLEVERCGLFTLDEQGWLRGTYGTDGQRRTSDEREAHFAPVNLQGLDVASSQLWNIIESEHAYWEGDQHRRFGAGWVGTTFIRTRERVMGVLYNDTAITHTPVNEAQQEVLAVYCSLLGSLIELKHAERERQESELLYRRAIGAAGAVPYYLDYATESYRFMGEGIQAMTGVLPDEMQPLVWNRLILEAYPLGQAHDLSHPEAVRETRAGHVNEWRCDYRIRKQDGLERWITDASIQVVDEQGQPRGAIGILQDITDRKQVELALRESEATTRALLEAIPDAFFRFDAQGVFKEYIPSKDFASLLPPSEFIGRPYAMALPPDMVQQLDLNFRQVLEQGEMRSYEYPLPLGEQMHYFEARLVKMTQGDVLGMVRDVTDRKQAELALQQREAYLRSIFDNFPYWVWLKDADSRFLAVNQTMAQAFGFEQTRALIGKTDREIATPELAEKYRADDLAVMESRTQKLVEEIVLDQGDERWFETFKSPIYDAQGRVIGTTGFAHDITARRQAEAAMRESEALFRHLADNAPALIAMSDEAGTATYLNRAWREFRGEVPNLPLDEWSAQIHPADRDRYLYEFRSTLQARRRFTTEYRLRRADGQYRWLLDTMVPRYAADERFAGLIGIAIDITDRKNAEEALRRSEARLRLLTENMVDTISQVDAQYNLLYVSPSIERVLGLRPTELLGQRLLDMLHPDDARTFYHQMIMAATLRAPTLRLVYRQRHAAGHYLWIESEIQLLYDRAGEFAGAVFGSRDVSARQQAEAARENLIKELEEKNAELERFTYTVSHDLKSPLITIRGFLGFLEKDAASGNFDRLHTDIGRIADATTRMQRLLDELLSLSRVGRIANAPQEIAFDAIAREAVELVQGRIMARGVHVEIADNLPTVYGDHARLVEVLQNLVDNAVKFMGDQPDPRIMIGALGADREGLPIFFVQDNGIGIDPSYHERVFGLFNKLDTQSEGTGVGLALVKRIIEVHGGHIWAESEGLGHGATFLFTLSRRPTTSNVEQA